MAVTYAIRFTVVPARRDRFLGPLGGVLNTMRTKPMFHRAALHDDSSDPARFLLVETWEDPDDVVDVQLARPYREVFHSALPELLAAERDIEVWRPLRSDDATG